MQEMSVKTYLGSHPTPKTLPTKLHSVNSEPNDHKRVLLPLGGKILLVDRDKKEHMCNLIVAWQADKIETSEAAHTTLLKLD